MSCSRSALASISSVVALLVMTGIHHIFRLGIELTIPTLIAIALAIGLWVFYGRLRKPSLLTAYAVYTALLVFWFGFLDGFLDHVFKASGLDNVTFLPGSEAEVVATVMQLWSEEASTAFYEGTGIASAVLALVATLATGAFLYREVTPRPSAA